VPFPDANAHRIHPEDPGDPDRVVGFLVRCLFIMFAEDVELLPPRSFTELPGRVGTERRRGGPNGSGVGDEGEGKLGAGPVGLHQRRDAKAEEAHRLGGRVGPVE